jgi:hypothetical protein
MTRRVEIVVDELVFRGLSPEAARAAAAELEARLAELAAADAEIPARAEHSRRLPAIDAPADGVGNAVGDAVWAALAGGEAR